MHERIKSKTVSSTHLRTKAITTESSFCALHELREIQLS